MESHVWKINSLSLSLLQGVYRSRGLDTFTPKPAPPIGFCGDKCSCPSHDPTISLNSRALCLTSLVQDYSADYSARSYSAPARPRGPPAPGSMLNRVQNSLTSSVYGPADQNGEDENYQQVPVNALKQIFNQPDYAAQHGNTLLLAHFILSHNYHQ